MQLQLFVITLVWAFFACTQKNRSTEWPVYGGNKERTHYSPLEQIDTSNVSRLQVAWEYHTGDGDSMTQMQVNPLILDSTMFVVSPHLKQQVWANVSAYGYRSLYSLHWSLFPR